MSMENNNNNLSPQKLRWAYWYVAHKSKIRVLLAGLLIIISMFLFSYSFINLFIYFIDMKDTEKMIQTMADDLINYDYFKQANKPEPLQVKEVNILRGGRVNKDSFFLYYDLVAKIENVNPRWKAEFDYYFFNSDWQGQKQKGFILPGENKVILDLGTKDVKEISAIKLAIENIKWQRFSSRRVENMDKFKRDRINLKVDNIEFIPASTIGSGSEAFVTASSVKFKIKNISAYNYWQLPLNIILMRGNQIVGVNSYIIDSFGSGAEKVVEVLWYVELPSVDNVLVEPDLDIFNEDNFADSAAAAGW